MPCFAVCNDLGATGDARCPWVLQQTQLEVSTTAAGASAAAASLAPGGSSKQARATAVHDSVHY